MFLSGLGHFYAAPGIGSAESTVLWSAGVIIGLAGVCAGYTAVRRPNGIAFRAIAIAGSLLSLVGASSNAWAMVG